MNRKYAIPAACALALHAALFLGSRDPATPARAKSGDEAIELVPRMTMPELPEEPPEDAPAASGRPDADTMPDLPEPSTRAKASDIVIEVPDNRVRPVLDGRTISPGPVGLPDGIAGGVPRLDGPIDVSNLDGGPRIRTQVAPIYPADARRLGIDGTVNVAFVVDETGRVVSPQVINCTDPVFVDAALRAVAKWRFEPGRHLGRLVRFRMAVPIVFRIDG